MTIHRNPRSLHRLSDSRIADMVRTYALMMTKGELPADFGLTILHKARRIDAETRREVEAMTAQRAGEDEMTDAESHAAAKSAIRRMRRARRFPEGTCPASRHVAMMAEALAKGQRYQMIEDEPVECAVSLASTVEALWRARAALARTGEG